MKKLFFILGIALLATACKETADTIHTTTATVTKVTKDSVYFDNGWKSEKFNEVEVGEEVEIEYIKVKKDK